jgi:hypothetical protein
MKTIHYPQSAEVRSMTDINGCYYEFENEEYLQIERQPEGASVVWSSALALHSGGP